MIILILKILNSVTAVILAFKLASQLPRVKMYKINIFITITIANYIFKSWIIGVIIFFVEIFFLIMTCKDRR